MTQVAIAQTVPHPGGDGGETIERRASEHDAGGLGATAFSILFSISGAHVINDMVQALLPAIYPDLKSAFNLSFGQIGIITLVYQLTASLLQPVAGLYADKHPRPYTLPFGTLFTLSALPILAFTHSYAGLLLSAALLGVGSSIFHPESSRVARMASGGRFGLAQAVFQVGGNFGTALGPLVAAIVVVRWGRVSSVGLMALVLVSTTILWRVANWYRTEGLARSLAFGKRTQKGIALSPRYVNVCMSLLLLLVFSKYFYMATMINYYTFFLIDRFGISVQLAQIYLFVFLGAVALGTVIGGQLGDRFGRKRVIWFSILGALPFTMLLPHLNLFWTGPVSFLIGLILASAFPAIVVFAQELMPKRVGMIAGLFFGFMFGVSGIAAALVGKEADVFGIQHVFVWCGFLPVLGIFAGFLPKESRLQQASK